MQFLDLDPFATMESVPDPAGIQPNGSGFGSDFNCRIWFQLSIEERRESDMYDRMHSKPKQIQTLQIQH